MQHTTLWWAMIGMKKKWLQLTEEVLIKWQISLTSGNKPTEFFVFSSKLALKIFIVFLKFFKKSLHSCEDFGQLVVGTVSCLWSTWLWVRWRHEYVSVLILWTLIHEFAHRNKRDVNPSSVSVTRFIRSKFSRWNEKGFSPASTTIQWQSLNHMENQYHDTLLQC